MDSDDIKKVTVYARRRAYILSLASAWGVDEDGFIIHRLCDIIEELMGDDPVQPSPMPDMSR